MINLDQVDSNVAKEVLMLILYGDENLQNKIPLEIINKLTLLASKSNIEVNIQSMETIKQDLSEEALDIFSIIYYAYIANDDLKKEILSSWINNEKNN